MPNVLTDYQTWNSTRVEHGNSFGDLAVKVIPKVYGQIIYWLLNGKVKNPALCHSFWISGKIFICCIHAKGKHRHSVLRQAVNWKRSSGNRKECVLCVCTGVCLRVSLSNVHWVLYKIFALYKIVCALCHHKCVFQEIFFISNYERKIKTLGFAKLIN